MRAYWRLVLEYLMLIGCVKLLGPYLELMRVICRDIGELFTYFHGSLQDVCINAVEYFVCNRQKYSPQKIQHRKPRQ